MTYEVKVTRKHIKDASESIVFSTEEKNWCPVALAMYEQIGKGKYKTKRRNMFGRYRKYIIFVNKRWKKGGASNMFSVAETIKCSTNALPDFIVKPLSPPVYLELPKEVKNFIIDFDNGKPVKPFSFSIEIKH